LRRPSNPHLHAALIAFGAYGRLSPIARSATFGGHITQFLNSLRGAPFAVGARMLIDDSKANAVTRQILGCAIEVHRELGPGLLESIYLQCLQYEFSTHGLRFIVQKSVPIAYKSISLEASYRIDLVVEDTVIVEVKCVDSLLPVHHAQTLTYLRLTECRAALLINFNVPRLMDGVRRLLNTRPTARAKRTEGAVVTRRHKATGTHEEDGSTGSTGRPATPAD